MWSSTTPSGGSAARTAAITAAIAAGSGPSVPVAAVSSGGTGPGTGPAVVSVPCVTLMPAPPGRLAAERSGHPLVGGEGEEFGALAGPRHLDEPRPSLAPPPAGEPAAAGAPAPAPSSPNPPFDQLAGDGLAVSEP